MPSDSVHYTKISSQDSKRSYRFSIVVTILLMIVSFAAGMLLSSTDGTTAQINNPQLTHTDEQLPDFLQKDVDFRLYWDVLTLLKQKYIGNDEIVDTQLFYGSLAGMVAALGDPYTVFLNPKTNEEFTQELQGKFQGIGAEVGLKKDGLTIIAPLPDSPAQRAGLQSRDRVLAVDGTATAGMSLDEAVSLIRGEKGTEVVLTVLSVNADEPRDVSIIRDDINIISVSWEEKENDIAYIRLSYFNQDTDLEFREVAQEVLSSNPSSIVLDLRNNPGGFLDVAVAIASYWVAEQPVVIEEFGTGEQKEYTAQKQTPFAGIPTVVLLNGGSASASEIVAGALQDYELASVIGEQSFGKGSVQDLTELSDGSSVKITIARWLTPRGTSIQENGITPTFRVENTPEDFEQDRDPQLDAALLFLQGQSIDALLVETDADATDQVVED